MRYPLLVSLLLLAGGHGVALAEVASVNNTPSQQATDPDPKAQSSAKEAKSVDSAEDKAYQEKMMQLSNAITQKIAAVQAKQKELEQEIYPASKPPIQFELDALNKDLDNLKMQKERLNSEKTAQDMSKKLEKSGK